MAAYSMDSRYRIAEDVLVRHVDGESVVLDLKSLHYFGLDMVGTRVWQLLMEDLQVAGVVEQMLEEFEVDPSALERDVSEFVAELAGAGLIAPVNDSNSP